MAIGQGESREYTLLSCVGISGKYDGGHHWRPKACKVGRENQDQPRRVWGGLPAASPGTRKSHSSLKLGAAGYCGVMCNFHPDLYARLCDVFADDPTEAERLQAFLGTAAFTESLAYPVTAKYHLKEIAGLPLDSLETRKRPVSDLTRYHRDCIQQMERLAEMMRTFYK